MVIFLKVSEMIIVSIGSLLMNPLFWIVIGIAYIIYNKSTYMEERMLGYRIPAWVKLKNSVLVGLLAGLLGSGVAVLLGITVEKYGMNSGNGSSGILYLWIIALMLSLFNIRYLCFSYAGGIVALMNLIFGFPGINPMGIIALVGILHMVESLLIWLDGFSDAVPVFLKRNDGNIVGGYVMNRIWPLPMMILFATLAIGGVGESVSMPDWWPIIREYGLDINNNDMMYIIQPIPILLGYGDMAITTTPEKRCRDSSLGLFIYSIILTILAVVGSKIRLIAYLAAIFSPLGHELLIINGQKSEEREKAVFDAPEKGLRVLYCYKGFPGDKMNIEPGDIILSINNRIIENEEDLASFLRTNPTYIWLDVLKLNGERKVLEYRDYARGISSLGMLIVPKNPNMYIELKTNARLIESIKSLWKKQNK